MLFKQRMLYSGDFHIKKAIIRLFFAETGRKKHTDDDIKQEELPDKQELEKGAITGFALDGQLRKTKAILSQDCLRFLNIHQNLT